VRFCSDLRCRRLRSLALGGSVNDEVVQAILDNPAMSNLRQLSFLENPRNRITDKGLTAILSSAALPNLVALTVVRKGLENSINLLLNDTVRPNLRHFVGPVSEPLSYKLGAKRPRLRVSTTLV